MPAFDLEELQATLRQMDQAIYKHEQWFKELERSLVCKSHFDQHDLTPHAHRLCKFGEWYYNYPPDKLRQLPSFIAIEGAHEHMHQLAASLLTASAAGKTISPREYDNYTDSVERFRVRLRTLKGELDEQLYNRDPLTGANSRVGLLAYLREQCELVKRRVQICSLAMMDIDSFKTINDGHGHLFGDQVLAETTSFLMTHLRAYDKVFRYGGDEFLISQPGLGAENSKIVMDRLCTELQLVAYSPPDGSTIKVTASFGIAELDPGQPIEATLVRADKALYAAKKAGRNCVQIWDSAL